MITLPIKKKWFDMIVSGEKKEEYRENNRYYMSRFGAHLNQKITIRLRNGYHRGSPSAICEVTPCIKIGKPEWGAEPNKMYITLQIFSVRLEIEKQ